MGADGLIPCQRHLFDIPRAIAYLNCAYMSPSLNAVAEAGQAGAARKRYPWTIRPADFAAGPAVARALFAELVGAEAADVAVVPSASYGISVAARNLPLGPGRRVLVLADQFPSNLYAWRARAAAEGGEVVAVDGPDLTAAVLGALDDRVAVAALPQCRWTDGALLDLVAIGTRARAVGAALVLDLTQSAGALPIDIGAVRPDFLVAATYKWLLGPYALGFLYVAPHRQGGEPLEHNWLNRAGSEDFARLVDYRDDFQPGARRFDMGQVANFATIDAGAAALRQILGWGVPRIQTTLRAMTDAIAAEAAGLGYAAAPGSLRAGHFLGLSHPDGLAPDLPNRLAAAGVHVSVRGARLRITPHLYNDAEDVARLLSALRGS